MFVSKFMPSKPLWLETFGDFIYFAYANMQMLIYAIDSRLSSFDKKCFMIRSKAFKAYREGTWKIHDLHINNVWKIHGGASYCWYCGKELEKKQSTIEHIFPRSKGGSDDMDNIVLICKSCNCSKGNLDLLEWYFERVGKWPAPYIFAYYLKHVYAYAMEHNLLNCTSEQIDSMELPFKYQYIPLKYPGSYIAEVQKTFADFEKLKSTRADNPDLYLSGN